MVEKHIFFGIGVYTDTKAASVKKMSSAVDQITSVEKCATVHVRRRLFQGERVVLLHPKSLLEAAKLGEETDWVDQTQGL